ncbi:hypothetical protein [Cupriavidus consociatus]|uniref:hypothetical protein n=1 Tax=Cupriavidus consociatus TaxID=2821357 RepID=UPI001AEB0182|nr:MULTISPECIES: hypothetical protein [unclassified Cupriavidus]MBP0625482.1 hypothetical protein [Cupriavidus sp. LEh25]MDK2662225.1 hypothetical protein [Cupriavidus sp. LEh21]
MFLCIETPSEFLARWSNSAEGLIDSYARFFSPEWLNQSILAGWRFGGTNIEIDVQIDKIVEALNELSKTNSDGNTLNVTGPSEDFIEKIKEINRIRDGMSTSRVDSIKAGLSSLRDRNPQQFANLINEINKR